MLCLVRLCRGYVEVMKEVGGGRRRLRVTGYDLKMTFSSRKKNPISYVEISTTDNENLVSEK
jgi:hypothetical protein